MPPSGFVRSGRVDSRLAAGLTRIAEVPTVIQPFVFDIVIQVGDRELLMQQDTRDVRRPIPKRLREVLVADEHDCLLALLINDQVFDLSKSLRAAAELRLSTQPIAQAGGDVYLLFDAGIRAFEIPVKGAWRTWGDARLGPFGQKPMWTREDGQESSTAEGYEVGETSADLVLTDPELEDVHLASFPCIRAVCSARKGVRSS